MLIRVNVPLTTYYRDMENIRLLLTKHRRRIHKYFYKFAGFDVNGFVDGDPYRVCQLGSQGCGFIISGVIVIVVDINKLDCAFMRDVYNLPPRFCGDVEDAEDEKREDTFEEWVRQRVMINACANPMENGAHGLTYNMETGEPNVIVD